MPDNLERASQYLDVEHGLRKGFEPQVDRMRRTLALLPDETGSLVDVGIGEGTWLELLARERPRLRLAALDLSRRRLADLHVLHADGSEVAKHFGDVAAMPLENASVDVVTLLEVVEHVADWQAAVREALRVARKRVLITVPYREELMDTICVHCHRTTPLWGHLHTFDERSFDVVAAGMRVTKRMIPWPVERSDGLIRWIYRTIRPRPGWMAVRIDKE